MEWTKLTSLPSAYEADLLAGRLKKGGIEARTMRSTDAPAAWLTSVGNPSGPIEIYIPANDEKAAREILRELDTPGPGRTGPSRHRAIQFIGRGMIAIALIGLVITMLVETLR